MELPIPPVGAAAPGAGADDSHQLQLVQLELINNLSNLFHNLEAKHTETRQLLDLLSGYICHKFGNESDFPEEINKILGFPIQITTKRSQNRNNPVPAAPAPANYRMSDCAVRLERIPDSLLAAPAPVETLDPLGLDLEHQNVEPKPEVFIPRKQKVEIPEEPAQPEPLVKLEASDFIDHLDPDPLDLPFLPTQEEMETTAPLPGPAFPPQIEIAPILLDPLVPVPPPRNRIFKIKRRPQRRGLVTGTHKTPNFKSKCKGQKAKRGYFPCPRQNCNNSYTSYTCLYVHLRETHGPVKRWLCPWDLDPTKEPCSYSSTRRYNLVQHWKKEHKPCEIPEFMFVIEPEVLPELLGTPSGASASGSPQVQEIQLQVQLIES